MMSFKPISSGQAVAQYYEDLAVEDYYEKGGEPPGIWLGSLRKNLYLQGQLQEGELANLLQGKHPSTGEILASNAGENHKAGWDMTFSAPKSVSVAWALGDDDTRRAIQQAQLKAVQAGLSFLEQHAFINRDRNGNAPVKQVIAAAYEHGTSREQDPQLHTHVLVANLGMREDSSVCAIDFDSRWKMAAGAIYRTELAAQLQHLGFSIEPDIKNTFAIGGIASDLCDLFSKRRKQILEQAALHGVTSSQGMQIATLASRQGKHEPVPRAEILSLWKKEAQEAGFAPNVIAQCQQFELSKTKMATHFELFESLNKQMSTFTLQQLYAAAAVAAQGHLDAQGVDQYVGSLLKDPELVGLKSVNPKLDRGVDNIEIRFTTQNQLQLEQLMLDQAQDRAMEAHYQVNIDYIPSDVDKLTGEQRAAFDHITEQAGGVKLVQGMAGTGKGFMLGIARQAWQSAGLEVRGAALAAKAANNLQDSTNISSQTLHSLIHELDSGQAELNKNTVLVIDEAGMVGSRQLNDILSHVHASGAKVILVGDSKQLQPIDAGGAFRLLADKLGYASLQHIQRQHDVADRKIVEQLASGLGAKALEAMRNQGNLHVKATQIQTIEQMVSDWWQSCKGQPDESSLMMAGTRSDLFQLNQLARAKMQEKGVLGFDCEVDICINDVQATREFAVGDRILFCKNQRHLGITNGESGQLTDINLSHKGHWEFTVEQDTGLSVTFSVTDDESVKNRYEAIDHGYALSVHKAQGITVDHAFVLASDSMLDREWTYVASSRARQKTQIYCTTQVEQELEWLMERSRQKDTALDYAVYKTEQQLEL